MDGGDIKISAVFSLVYDEVKTDTPTADSPGADLPGADSPVLPAVGNDEDSSFMSSTSSTDSAPDDNEEPPTLISATAPPEFVDRLRRNATPPILKPEDISRSSSASPVLPDDSKQWFLNDKTALSGSGCKRIAPSYVVLESVDQYMSNKTSISCRKFKGMFSGCTNMCKKMYFIRRLRSGDDVFNVKCPSKQCDFNFNDEHEQTKPKISRKSKLVKTKAVLKPKVSQIVQKVCIANRMTRVRRTFTKVPPEFRALAYALDGPEFDVVDEANLTEEERLKRQDELKRRKQRVLDVLVLRKQIEIKRSFNKKMKKLKPKLSAVRKSILKAEVTSSGRVCKRNQKYTGDFAFDVAQMQEQSCVDKANDQLKKLSVTAANLIKQKRKYVECSTNTSLSKKPKSESDIFIENPETESVVKFKSKSGSRKSKPLSKTKRRSSSDSKVNEKGILTKESAPISSLSTSKNNSAKKKSIHTKEFMSYSSVNAAKNSAVKDEVLIQHMPNEGSVIAEILQNKVKPKISTNKPGENTSALPSMEILEPGTRFPKPPIISVQNPPSTYVQKPPSNHAQKYPTSYVQKVLKSSIQTTKSNPVSTSYSNVGQTTNVQYMNVNTPKGAILVKTSQGLRYITPAASPVTATSNVTVVTSCKPSTNLTSPIVITMENGKPTIVPPTPVPKPVTSRQQVLELQNVRPADKGNLVYTTYRAPVATATTSSFTRPQPTPALSRFPIGTGSSVPPGVAFVQTLPNGPVNAVSLASPVPSVLRYPLMQVGSSLNTLPKSQGLANSATLTSLLTYPSLLQTNALSKAQFIPSPTTVTSAAAFNRMTPASATATLTGIATTVDTQSKVSFIPSEVIRKVNTSSTAKVPVNSSAMTNAQVISPGIPNAQITAPGVGNVAVNTSEKTKFYLLKIEGKNVLIPVNGSQFQPKAYVVNTEIATSLTPSVTSSVCSNLSPVPVPLKPTLAVEPSVKFPTQPLLPPGVKIKEEPLDDWSEHLMKSTQSSQKPVSTQSSQQPVSKEPFHGFKSMLQDRLDSSIKKKSSPSRASNTLNQNINNKFSVIQSEAILKKQRSSPAVSDGVDTETTPSSKHDTPQSDAETKSNAGNAEPAQDKPMAFTEALTAREERLRKLKELLKERQKAVDAIRPIKTETE